MRIRAMVERTGREQSETLSDFEFAIGLSLAMGVGPLALQGLMALGPFVTRDLGLDRTAFGSLATLSFAVAAVSSMLLLRVLDDVPVRGGLLGVFAGAGVALVIVGTAPTYTWLLVGVCVTGATQSVSNPLTNRLIAGRRNHGARGLVMGAKQSGVQMTQFVTGATLPVTAVGIGWRASILSTAVLVAAGAFLSVRTAGGAGPETPVARRAVWGAGRSTLPPAVWWLTGYSFLVGAGLQATNVYTPLYAFEDVGLSAATAGTTAAVAGGVGLGSRLCFGRIAERWARPRVFLALLAVASMLGALAILVAADHGVAWLWASSVVHGLSAISSNVVAMMALVMLVPVSQLGRATGMLMMAMYSGFSVGPIAFGALVDQTGEWSLGWLFVAVLYALACSLMFVWSARQVDR